MTAKEWIADQRRLWTIRERHGDPQPKELSVDQEMFLALEQEMVRTIDCLGQDLHHQGLVFRRIPIVEKGR
jgi:hypothetical protein